MPFESQEGVGVRLQRVSPSGEEGYPGRLDTTVTYALVPGALTIDYSAVTDGPTIVSLSPHAYFNLLDGGSTPVLEHALELRASDVLAIDEAGIPTGARHAVAGTPFDFRTLRTLGDGLDVRGPRGGYDHPFVLDGPPGEGPLRRVATLREPITGRRMDLETTAPCLQLYSGQHLPSGPRSGPFHAVCLEPQSYPDAPNHPAFPSARLEAGAEFRRTTVLRFAPPFGS